MKKEKDGEDFTIFIGKRYNLVVPDLLEGLDGQLWEFLNVVQDSMISNRRECV